MAANRPPYPSAESPPYSSTGTNRPGATSNNNASTMVKYAPYDYPPPPLAPPNHRSEYPRDTRSRGPSIGNQQIPSTPPVPNAQPYSPPYIVETPRQPRQQQQQQQRQPSSSWQDAHRPSITYADDPPPPNQHYSSSPNANSYIRPQPGGRRLSASSAHSHHSRSSHRSEHSQRSSASRSRDRRSSYDDDYDNREEDKQPRKHHHHKQSKHNDDHRPTMGDTVYGIFDYFKSALSPSDKH